jgi:L-ribulokinase
VVSLGSAIFAFLAAGTFKTVDEAQDKICPAHKVYDPESNAQKVYDQLYPLYRDLYFALGEPGKNPLGSVLPTLIRVAEQAHKSQSLTTA